jgi:hypothetical protein
MKIFISFINHSFSKLSYNVSGLCVVALSKTLKLTTTLDRAITQNPCYVPLNFKTDEKI